MKRLERIHLLRQLRTHGPMPARELVERANTECDHDLLEEVRAISPRGITAKLQGMSLDGLVNGRLSAPGGDIVWKTTDRGDSLADTLPSEDV